MSKTTHRPERVPSKTVESLSDDQCDQLLAFFDIKEPGSMKRLLANRDRFAVLLMLDAGLRVGEVVKLVISDLHVAGSPVGMLHVRKEISKTGVAGDIPITIRLHQAIEIMWLSIWKPKNVPHWYSALTLGGERSSVTVRQLQRIIRRAGKDALQIDLHPHMLRHTFATRLMRRCSIRVVQQLLRHASIQSTQIYTHPNNQDLQEAIDSLNSSSSVTSKPGQQSALHSDPKYA